MSFQVKPASLAGRLGEGLGKGFAEQVPREAERYRLSQGLQNIRNTPNMSQTDRLISLYSTPGITPEMASTIAPLLAQEQVKQNRQNRGGQQNVNPPSQIPMPPRQVPQQTGIQSPEIQEQINTKNLNQGNINPQAQPQYQQNQQVNPSITTPEAQQSLLKPVLNATPEQLAQRGYELENLYGLPPGSGYNEAVKEDQTRVANETEMQNLAARESAVKNQVDNQFTTTLGNLGSDLGVGFGEERKKELNNAYEDVASGRKTVLQATNEASERLHKVAEDLTSLKKIGSTWFPGSEESLKSMKQISNRFAKRNQQKLFYNTLQSDIGLSPSYAKYLANPVSTPYANFLKSTKDINAPLNLSRKAIPKKVDNAKIAEQLLESLGKNDSILSGLLELGRKGYDKGLIMEEVRRLNKNGRELYPTQEDELKENPNQRRSLYDIYYFSVPGIDKLLEQND